MNKVIHTDWGYISYNPDTTVGIGGLLDAMLFGEPEDRPTEETAIVANDRFYILYGDWREELKGKSFDECLEIFRNNPEHHGHSTEYPPDVR